MVGVPAPDAVMLLMVSVCRSVLRCWLGRLHRGWTRLDWNITALLINLLSTYGSFRVHLACSIFSIVYFSKPLRLGSGVSISGIKKKKKVTAHLCSSGKHRCNGYISESVVCLLLRGVGCGDITAAMAKRKTI